MLWSELVYVCWLVFLVRYLLNWNILWLKIILNSVKKLGVFIYIWYIFDIRVWVKLVKFYNVLLDIENFLNVFFYNDDFIFNKWIMIILCNLVLKSLYEMLNEFYCKS